MTRDVLARIASTLLAHVRLAHLIGHDGRPTPECRSRGLSSGERVMVALALAILDYSGLEPAVHVSDLMRLDNANLRAAGEALIALAEDR